MSDRYAEFKQHLSRIEIPFGWKWTQIREENAGFEAILTAPWWAFCKNRIGRLRVESWVEIVSSFDSTQISPALTREVNALIEDMR